MIDLIIFILFILSFVFLIFNNVNLKILKNNLLKELLVSNIKILSLEKTIESNDTNNNLDSDSFLKFISDSRDIAFTYIEDVQQKIIDLDTNLKLKIASLNLENNKDNYKELASFVLLELNKIKEILPDSDINGR